MRVRVNARVGLGLASKTGMESGSRSECAVLSAYRRLQASRLADGCVQAPPPVHRFCAIGWVLGEGAEPQHCPVEAVAIAADERMMKGDGCGCCWVDSMKLLDPVTP